MKKKLIVTLAAALVVVQSISTSSIFADSNQKEVVSTSENQNKAYPNDIFIRGISVQGHKYHGGYIRFDVSNPDNKKIVVQEVLGVQYATHPNFRNRTYFSMKLYDAYGNLKKELDLKGNDRMDKLKEFNNIPFEYGDYLKLDVIELNSLRINGTILNNQKYDGDVIPKWVLKQNHYEITEAGLRLVYETGETSESKESYWNRKDQFSLNVKFAKNKEEFDNDTKSVLLIKDENGQVVKEVDGYLTNRYSDDPSNFNGSQFNLTQEILKQLQKGKYFFSLQLKKNGVQYANVEIKQNELTGSTSKYSDINKTESKVFENKEYKFKTENSKTGRIVLEVTDKTTQN